MKKQLNIRVFGLVQGVYFRQSTKEKAISLNISGIVMNEDEGSVYICALGSEEALSVFLNFCKTGPPMAKVKHILVEESERMNFVDFRILK